MLKIRVISATVGIIILVAIMSLGPEVLGVGISILALIGIHEFYNSVSNAGNRPVRVIGYISCIPLFLTGISGGFNWVNTYLNTSNLTGIFFLCLFIIILVLFSLIVFLHERYNIVDIAITLFGAAYVVFLFSFIILTRNLKNGILFVWLIFIGAWATDTFAYFTGKFLGKNKVLPVISPKKTLEGTIGGVIGTIAVTAVYGILIINRSFSYYIPIYHFIIIGALSGLISQIGDWGASAIKRYVKIKDYGNVMPGHGGILDRFDSILFTAPIVYFYYIFILK